MTSQEIISDEEIEKVYEGIYFGFTNITKRQSINAYLLKKVCGIYCCQESSKIIRKLELINNRGNLTKRGQRYFFAVFGNGIL